MREKDKEIIMIVAAIILGQKTAFTHEEAIDAAINMNKIVELKLEEQSQMAGAEKAIRRGGKDAKN